MDFKKNPRTDFKDTGKMSKEEARTEIESLRGGNQRRINTGGRGQKAG
jgi:hypothetical protein